MTNKCFRVGIFTDTHLGFKFDSSENEEDSFLPYEEALQIFKKKNVDVILHSGDFFELQKPQLHVIIRAIEITQNYLLNNDSKEKTFPDVISKGDLTGQLNWTIPSNMVDIPMFIIQGNHDRAYGEKVLKSPIDLLAYAHTLNFIRNIPQDDIIHIKPIVLEHNSIRLAIYGLGYIEKKKFERLLEENKIYLEPPPLEDGKTSFSILLMHQDRGNIDSKLEKKLPPKGEPNHIDLIVWGHEHKNECECHEIGNSETFITQPGSTIATAIDKKYMDPRSIAILEIFEGNWVLQKIDLDKPRKIVNETIDLNTLLKGATSIDMKNARIQEKVDEILSEFMNPYYEDPLRKIRVSFNLEYSSINIQDLDLDSIEKRYDQWVIETNKMFKKINKTSNYSIGEGIELKNGYRSDIIEEMVKEALNEEMFEIINLDQLHNFLNTSINEKSKKETIGNSINNQIKYILDFMNDSFQGLNFDEEHFDEEPFNEERVKKFILERRSEMPSYIEVTKERSDSKSSKGSPTKVKPKAESSNESPTKNKPRRRESKK